MKPGVVDSRNIAERRARVADALQLIDEILVVGAGESVPLPECIDQTYPFRVHPEYFYLTGVDSPGGVIAFDPKDRSRERWVFFVPDVTEAERTWEGRTQQSGRSLSALEPWLMARRGRPIVNLGERLRGVRSDDALIARAREQFTHARRAKDTTELRLLRHAANATARGFCAVRKYLRPGVTERALQIELEVAFYRVGADRTGYGTIVASGPNTAVMHFSPSGRKLRRGAFVLIDAGAEVGRYVSDVTRTFVAGGKALPFLRELFVFVVVVEVVGMSRCVRGA